MELGQYYQCFVNYRVEPKELSSWIPQGLEIELFEGRPVVSWVFATVQPSKIWGLRWPSKEWVYSLSLRTYVRNKIGNQHQRGFFNLTGYLSTSWSVRALSWLGFGTMQRLFMDRSVHFEPHEKSSRGVFQYQWRLKETEDWKVLKLRTLGVPEPAMAGYLEYFTTERELQFLSSDKLKSGIVHQHEPWYLWEIDELTLPQKWPGTLFNQFNTQKPLSAFVVKGSKVQLKKIKF